MRVLLLQDVENLGKKYEIKSVKSGYARNFLIPNNLAKPATKEVMTWLETQKQDESQKAEEGLKKIQETASSLDGLELLIPVKIGEEGQLFESITAQKIAEKLKESGFEVKKSQVDLAEPIKEIGEYPTKIKLEHNLESEIRVIITEEKE